MAFGRKAKRIAALEAELKDVRENMAIAVFPNGVLTGRVEVRKGRWYRVGYRFMHNGGPFLDVADLLLCEDPDIRNYFDGQSS